MTSILSSPIVRNWPKPNDTPPPEPAAPPPPAFEPSHNPLLEGSGPKHLPVNVYLAKMEYEQRLRTQTLEKTQTPEAPAIDTTLAQAATQTQAVESATPAVTKTPTADPLEIAALELLLADPAIQEIIQHFGGPREFPASGNPVADSLIERYGVLLVIQLDQLQVAQREVQRLYMEKLGASFANPDVGIPGSIYSFSTGRWEFHLDVFTRMWSQGDSPAQKARTTLYGGSEAVQSHIDTAQKALYWTLNGDRLHWKYPESDESGLHAGSVQLVNGSLTPITPFHHSANKISDHNLVWFDIQKGWVTYAGNFKQGRTERFFSTVIPLAAATVGGWAASTAVANAGGNTVLQGMAAGAAASATGQWAGNGKIDFKTLLTSALAGGLGTAITEIPAISQHLNAPSNAFSQRLMQHTGKASLQGAIQAVLGGQFKDGAIHSLMASVAGEIGARLRVEISQIKNLSRTEANTLRLLARATESALRIAANPQDKGYAFASDFLTSFIGDTIKKESIEKENDTTQSIEANEIKQDEKTTTSSAASQENTIEPSELEAPETIHAPTSLSSTPPDTTHASDAMLDVVPDDTQAYFDDSGALIVTASRIESEPDTFGWVVDPIFWDNFDAHAGGAIVGVGESFIRMAYDTAVVGSNIIIQVGDILTGFANHDHPFIQKVWQDQQAIGDGIIRFISHPIQSFEKAIANFKAGRNAALALDTPFAQSRALGNLFNTAGQTIATLGYGATPVLTKAGTITIRATAEGLFVGPLIWFVRRATRGCELWDWAGNCKKFQTNASYQPQKSSKFHKPRAKKCGCTL